MAMAATMHTYQLYARVEETILTRFYVCQAGS